MTDINHRAEIFFAECEDKVSQKTLDFLEDAHELEAQCPVLHEKFFLSHGLNPGQKCLNARGQVEVHLELVQFWMQWLGCFFLTELVHLGFEGHFYLILDFLTLFVFQSPQLIIKVRADFLMDFLMSKVIGMGAVDESGHILCVKLLMLFHLSSKRFLLGMLSMPLSSKELTSIQFRSFYNLLIYFTESAIDCQLLLKPSHELF